LAFWRQPKKMGTAKVWESVWVEITSAPLGGGTRPGGMHAEVLIVDADRGLRLDPETATIVPEQ
jgi:hypothetical protein